MSFIPSGTTVTVETKWFPPLTVELSGAEGPPPLITRLLKPRVTVAIKGLGQVAQVAPAGAPEPNEWPKVKIGLAVATAIVVFSILRIVR